MGRPPKVALQKEVRRRRAETATLEEVAKSYNVGVASDFKAPVLMDPHRKSRSPVMPPGARLMRKPHTTTDAIRA
jgi:hypothetical protein